MNWQEIPDFEQKGKFLNLKSQVKHLSQIFVLTLEAKQNSTKNSPPSLSIIKEEASHCVDANRESLVSVAKEAAAPCIL